MTLSVLLSSSFSIAQERARIIGGIAAEPSRWPGTVSLQAPGAGHFCGGTLVDRNWVLTAAHCVQTRNTFFVVAGRHDLRISTLGFVASPDLVVTHADFDAFSLNNDIALIRLTEELPLEPVKLVSINHARRVERSSRRRKRTYSVVGWGFTSEFGEVSAQLREVQVHHVSRRSCNRAYRNFTSITRSMLCAGKPSGGQDACDGDSGGPLFIRGRNRISQAGITSWGLGCGRAGFPGVYTDISRFKSWISLVIQSFSE